MANDYFPSLSSLITLDDLPQELDFIEAGISSVFDNVYFRDLQFTRSPKGDSAYYSLVLILNRAVGIGIPGADIKIALNPDFQTGTMTEIPVTLEYEWKLLALLKKIKKFTTGEFSFDAKAFFDLLSDVTGLTQEGLLQNALQQFTGASDVLAAINVFIDSANAKYGTAVPHSAETDPARALAEALLLVSVAAVKDPFTIIYEIYLEGGTAEEVLDKVKALFAPCFDGDPIAYVKDLLIPKISATLSLAPAGIGIVFPRKYLVPLDAAHGLEAFPETGTATDKMSILGFGIGKFSFSTVSGFGDDEQLSATLNYPSMIGNTGLIINLQNAKLDLSRKTNIAEATQDGRPLDFMGVYIQEVSITLPEKWFKQADHATAMIYGRQLLIGTGGLSGEIGLEATAVGRALPAGQKPAVKVKLGDNDGFELGFEKFSLTFRQNAVTACDIKGYLKIKGFKDASGDDAKIDIIVSISDNGDFSITASEQQGISLIKIQNIVDIKIKSLSIGQKNNKFFLALSGVLDFADQSGSSNGGFIADNLPKDIEIQKLVIWQDGAFELEGGGITLRKPLAMKIGPVALSITAIHFGSHEQTHNGVLRKYKFFGFDGGVSIKPGGVDARGDGIKFYFTVDNGPGKDLDVFMRIQSIAIDIMIPGSAKPDTAAVILKGYLAMKSPSDGATGSNAGTEYSGGIELTLPKLKIAGSAAMRFNTSVPSFIIDIGLELPTALPLGATGLGIYGFRALLGLRYVASREYVGLAADAEWWQYYKKKVAPDNKEGIFINKMAQRNGFSVGAGVSLCTTADSGKTFSAKLFFMLSLPDVFLLQGQAAFVSERIGLNDPNDPPFFALIAISATSVETALGVNYKMPNSGDDIGKIAKVDGVLELAFFWGNSFSWYLNVGKDTPEDRRIRARIFDLFDCYFFLMISSQGLFVGAGASIAFNKTFAGVVKVKLSAYLDMRGRISGKPTQVGASIQLGASLELSVFGIGFALSADAGLAAEAPKPFIISGFFKVKFKILWKTFSFNVDFTWNFSSELDLSELALLDGVVENIAKAINAHTKEAFPLFIQQLAGVDAPMPGLPWADFEKYTIPQDSFIDIEFKQGMHATGADASLANFNDINFGFEYTALIPPQQGKSKQVKHEFYVDKIELKIWNPQTSAWDDYHPYKAMTPLANLPGLDIAPHATFDAYVDAKNLKFGSWQIRQPNKVSNLRVMATNPLSYMTQGVPFIPEELHITSKTVFCSTPPKQKICVEVAQLGRPDVPANESLIFDGVMFRLIAGPDPAPGGRIVNQAFSGVNRALRVFADESLEIYPPKPSPYTSILLQMSTADVKIRYYKRIQTALDASRMPVFGWQLVSTVSKTASQVASPLVFDDAANPIGKIVISAGKCRAVCGRPTPEAKYLHTFLSTLGQLRHLTEREVVHLIKFEEYQDAYFLTSLLPKSANGDQSTWQMIKEANDLRVIDCILLNVVKESKKFCTFHLEIVTPEFKPNFSQLVKVLEVRPSPQPGQDGLCFGFTAKAVFEYEGELQKAEIKGVSCYPIATCEAKKCAVLVYKFCYLPEADVVFNDTIPTISTVQQNNQAMVEAMSKLLQPIWRPQSVFSIRIHTRDRLSAKGDFQTEYPRAYFIGFKTAGPLGHFHQYQNYANVDTIRPDYAVLLAADKEEEFKLKSLKYYVDMEKSYPNADGRLTLAKPLFYRNPKLLLFFAKDYIYNMYGDWDVYKGNPRLDSHIRAVIIDPADSPANPSIFRVDAAWERNTVPTISVDESTLTNFQANGVVCTTTSDITKIGMNAVFIVPELKPQKTYAAQFHAGFKRHTDADFTYREGHRYVFATSRYPDFAAQVNSHLVATDFDPITHAVTHQEKALYDIALTLNAADISRAQSVLGNTDDDALKIQFMHVFDRLMDGGLMLPAQQAAVNTEFNVVRDAATNRILGILIKNPEPFNDPKIPTASLDAKKVVELRVDGGASNLFKCVYSKDTSALFVTGADNALAMPSGNYVFTFRYLEWDRNLKDYVVAATVADLSFTI